MVRRYVRPRRRRASSTSAAASARTSVASAHSATTSTASRSSRSASPRPARELPNIVVGVGEALPYPDDRFDLVFSNEVIEHVDDDRATAAEMVRVTRPGGSIVAFAPNRLYPFETHGAYVGGRYVFGNIPLVNWLPDPLRDRFAPHVRAYTQRGLRRLFAGSRCASSEHRVIYPGFDNVSARHPTLGRLLRRALYVAEKTPLHVFGLSHFLVLRKRGGASWDRANRHARASKRSG